MAGLSLSSIVILGDLTLIVGHRAVEDSSSGVLTDFSRKLFFLAAWCIFTGVFWVAGRLAGLGAFFVYPLYLNAILFFVYLFYTANSLNKFVREYDVSEEEKLEKMDDSENLANDYYVKYD